MANPRKLFGSLDFERHVGRGENPNGQVSVVASDIFVDGKAASEESRAYFYGWSRDGERWNGSTTLPEIVVRRLR